MGMYMYSRHNRAGDRVTTMALFILRKAYQVASTEQVNGLISFVRLYVHGKHDGQSRDSTESCDSRSTETTGRYHPIGPLCTYLSYQQIA